MPDYRIVSPWFVDAPSATPRLFSADADAIIETQPLGGADQTDAIAPIHRTVADQVAFAFERGARPMAILGDCCQTIGVVAGLTRRGLAPTLVWIDSHGDFNTWATTPSGFLGGMPLAMLTGRGDQRMLQAIGLTPMRDEHVVLSDARDLDPGERELVAASSMRHVANVTDIVASLPDGPLYVHFDTDIIDAREAPAFKYPVAGGPSSREVRAVIAALEATGRVVAASATVGWSVEKDVDGKTATAVRHAMAPLFGDFAAA